MKLALREMRRRPGRFATATTILVLIALLLLFLGGLLDGLIASSTSAIRAQPGDVIVYSATSQQSFPSSRITLDQRELIAAIDGVGDVGGLNVTQLGARLADRDPRDLIDVAVIGYELAPAGLGPPPADGGAYADDALQAEGLAVGDEVLVGPARTPITIEGFVADLPYNGQATLWVSPNEWQAVQAANRPDAGVAPGTVQALVLTSDGATSGEDLAQRVDAATGGATSSLTIAAAAEAQPGVQEQRSTFNQIIGVTTVIAVVVIALFFALLIVERTALYGVLKAIGAKSSTLFGGVVVQALVVTVIAGTIASAAAALLALALPAGSIPFVMTPARIATTVVLLLVAAIIGCAFSLRRVLRIDPASTIGTAS